MKSRTLSMITSHIDCGSADELESKSNAESKQVKVKKLRFADNDGFVDLADGLLDDLKSEHPLDEFPDFPQRAQTDHDVDGMTEDMITFDVDTIKQINLDDDHKDELKMRRTDSNLKPSIAKSLARNSLQESSKVQD